MIIESNHPIVSVVDKVREYYKVNKKLGGLITVTETVYQEKWGRDLLVVFPKMSKHDKVFINGHEFIPKSDMEEA